MLDKEIISGIPSIMRTREEGNAFFACAKKFIFILRVVCNVFWCSRKSLSDLA